MTVGNCQGLRLADGSAAQEGQVWKTGWAVTRGQEPADDDERGPFPPARGPPGRGQAGRGYRDLFVICCLPPGAWHLRVFRA